MVRVPRRPPASRYLLLLLLTLVVTSCGGRPLEDVGDFSRDFVHGDASTTTEPIPTGDDPDARPLPLRRAVELSWFNTDPVAVIALDARGVIGAAWDRSGGSERFVQAGPLEIATALPGVEFPEFVPDAVRVITSQLVFDTDAANLDPGTSATFGLWTTTPYSVARDVAQVAVLSVGLGAAGTFAAISATQVDGGRELQWGFGDYSYVLFCRTSVEEDVCWRMAESMTPLAALAPPVEQS